MRLIDADKLVAELRRFERLLRDGLKGNTGRRSIGCIEDAIKIIEYADTVEVEDGSIKSED